IRNSVNSPTRSPQLEMPVMQKKILIRTLHPGRVRLSIGSRTVNGPFEQNALPESAATTVSAPIKERESER
ncbi:MAG: hypothetical protein ACK58T_30775, partial [Phycisphaerae bacterium]